MSQMFFRATFMPTDSKGANDLFLDCTFGLLGSARVKASSKYVGEINPRLHWKELKELKATLNINNNPCTFYLQLILDWLLNY